MVLITGKNNLIQDQIDLGDQTKVQLIQRGQKYGPFVWGWYNGVPAGLDSE